jgi:hypothetical protein
MGLLLFLMHIVMHIQALIKVAGTGFPVIFYDQFLSVSGYNVYAIPLK